LETADDQGKHQDQFSISDRSSHCFSPFTAEFSELLSMMSTKTMLSLMSTQQKLLAKALWEAENFGGKPLPGQLQEVYPKRDYYELVMMMEHQRQWEEKQRYCKAAKSC
jgi:hypothetical protein